MRAFVNGLPSSDPAEEFSATGSFFYDQQPEDSAFSYVEVYGGSLLKSNFPGLAADYAAFGQASANVLSANVAQVATQLIVGPGTLPQRAAWEDVPASGGFLYVNGNADIESTLFLPTIHTHRASATTYVGATIPGVLGAAALAAQPDPWTMFGVVAP